jgi:hypothetical protein
MNFFEELQGNYEEPLTERIQVVNKKNHQPTEFDFYIGRPCALGNPYSHVPSKYAKQKTSSRQEALDAFEKYIDSIYLNLNSEEQIEEVEYRLALQKLKNFFLEKGRVNLVCWCAPQPCHGDIIKKWLIEQVKQGS